MVEMSVDCVNDNRVKHFCRNCGAEEITEIKEGNNIQESV